MPNRKPNRKTSAEDSGRQRRTSHRIEVSLPLLIRGRDVHDDPFEDTAASYNLSREGASFLTRRELQVGQPLDLIVRLPRPGRPAGEGDFETTADVMRVVDKGHGEWEVGVHFTGPRFRTYMSETA